MDDLRAEDERCGVEMLDLAVQRVSLVYKSSRPATVDKWPNLSMYCHGGAPDVRAGDTRHHWSLRLSEHANRVPIPTLDTRQVSGDK